MKTVYVTNDGKIFKDKEAASRHEQGYTCYNATGELVENTSDAIVVYFKNSRGVWNFKKQCVANDDPFVEGLEETATDIVYVWDHEKEQYIAVNPTNAPGLVKALIDCCPIYNNKALKEVLQEGLIRL